MFYNLDSVLYLTQYRAYDPVVGHWLSRDPIGEISDSIGKPTRHITQCNVCYTDIYNTASLAYANDLPSIMRYVGSIWLKLLTSLRIARLMCPHYGQYLGHPRRRVAEHGKGSNGTRGGASNCAFAEWRVDWG